MNRGRRQIIATLAAGMLGVGGSVAQSRPARIAVLSRSPDALNIGYIRDGLRVLGHVEGGTYVLEPRDGGGTNAGLRSVAIEVVRTNPNVIFATHGEAAQAAKAATATIPIVFGSPDPVAEGLVASLAHPGGNLTGFASLANENSGKRVEILRELLPGLRRLGVFHTEAGTRGSDSQLIVYREATERFGIELVPVFAADQGLATAFEAAMRERVDALAAINSQVFNVPLMAALAARHQIPMVHNDSTVVAAGGLISYGLDVTLRGRRLAVLIDRILKGTPPAALPVERATHFELAINLRTARDLGLTVPPSLIALADRVIE